MRATILPGWSGAPARLVESVLALAALIWLAEALGTFGAYGEATMIVACVALAALSLAVCARLDARRAPGPAATPARAAGLADRDLARGRRLRRRSPRPGWCRRWAASPGAWTAPTRSGTTCRSSVRFAEGGDLGAIDFFDPIFFASYYPANSEVLHSIPLLAFGRDILSPLLNLGFLALGLLASYCIGRPYGLGPQSLIGGAIALGAQMLIEFQAGEALNDIVGVAFVLAAVAMLVNASAAARVQADPGDQGPPPASGANLALSGETRHLRGARRRRHRGGPGRGDQALVPRPRTCPVRRRRS